MKFSERWLRTMCNPAIGSDALADALTMAGLEVEAREPAAPPFTGVVAGRIVRVAPHPSADKLCVCVVDAGAHGQRNVVCGAPNAAAGMIAPLAIIGAVLPDGTTIRQAEIRGVASEGMLCSARELGLDDDGSGLLALPFDVEPGSALREALELDDTLVTLKLTPNRADCLSTLGIAREVSAITGAPLVAPRIAPAPSMTHAVQRVRVEEPAACPRFASRVIEGLDPRAPTPRWMKRRLERSGIRSISAIVDITNYVMLEIGQPLHAYDRALLEGDIVVRFARRGETLLLLNGETLALDADLLLVADEQKPLGLAGIMGGEYSGIGDTTRDVFLEGAFWTPAVIQGRMRRLGFHSDAGYRFERGVDFELQAAGVERATELLLAICGGRAGPLSDQKATPPAREPVRVRTARVRRLLGVGLTPDSIGDVFARLCLAFERSGEDFIVTPPSYRFDLAIEEDFVEEVARIRGFDSIPVAPAVHGSSMLAWPEERRGAAALRQRLVARDWQEIVTFSFVDAGVEAALGGATPPIRVLNPIASHLAVMRRSLLPGLVETLRANLAHRASRVRVFEIGRVYHAARADETAQPRRLGGLAYGPAVPEQWGASSRPVDFFDVKGDVEALAAPRRVSTRPASHPALHPGRSAVMTIDGEDAGWIGELHPRLARRFELPRAPVVFELSLDALARVPLPCARPVSRQPVVRRDLALVVDEAVAAGEVLAALEAGKPPHVVALQPFDVYRGSGLPNGRKSVAILVLMQDTARTLTDADVDATVADLLSIANTRFGAVLRT